jgi:hypothetical protein
MWEPGLPAMAVEQSPRVWRMYRYRRQASSHIGDLCCLQMGGSRTD